MKLLFFILLFSSTVHAETLEELKARIDTWWGTNSTAFGSAQAAFISSRPVYFQGLKTHTVAPDHKPSKSDDKVGDKLDVSPKGQGVTWVEFMPEIAAEPLPCALTIDVYEGPQGSGWSVTFTVKYEGIFYLKRINTGPEEFRNMEWEVGG